MLQMAGGIQNPKHNPETWTFEAAEENYWDERSWEF